jgi:hypothetical protein
VPKKAQFTHERIEYNVFLFDEPLKDSKSLKIFKISLTFRFDKLSHLSKSVHIGENSQILTVSNKKNIVVTICYIQCIFLTVAIGNCMVKLIPPVNFCSDENIQTIFGTKLEDFLNYRIVYNSIS